MLLPEGWYTAELVVHLLGDDAEGGNDGYHIPAVQRIGGHVLVQVGGNRHNRVGLAQLPDNLLDPIGLALAEVRRQARPGGGR